MKKKKILSLIFTVFIPAVAFAEDPPIDSLDDIATTLTKWVQWATGFFWAIAVGSGIIAAIMFITAGGQPEKAKTARQMLLYTIIAGGVAILSYGVKTIIGNLLAGT